jgi:lipoate-protein ligase A
MEKDAQLLAELDPTGLPILHFYEWASPSATFGHFIHPEEHLRVELNELDLARRPTGGGIVFHLWDLAFSVLIPSAHPACSNNTLENYQFINSFVLDAVLALFPVQASLIPESATAQGPNCSHFCMARPTVYDAVANGCKIAGAAQRRTKRGYLHQGTVSLAFPDLGLLSRVLIASEELTAAMSEYSFAPLGENCSPAQLAEARSALKEQLQQKFLAKLSRLSI